MVRFDLLSRAHLLVQKNMVRFDLLSRAHLLVQKNMVDFTVFVPIAKAKDMIHD